MLQSSGHPLQQTLSDSGQALLSPLLFPPALSSDARLSDGSSLARTPVPCFLACLLRFLLLCKSVSTASCLGGASGKKSTCPVQEMRLGSLVQDDPLENPMDRGA